MAPGHLSAPSIAALIVYITYAHTLMFAHTPFMNTVEILDPFLIIIS